MMGHFTYAISIEARRGDFTLPGRRILNRLGNKDLSKDIEASGKSYSALLSRLDVVILIIREDPAHWRNGWAAEAIQSFRESGRPLVLPMILDDFVVVDLCMNDLETKALLDEAKPEIGNFFDPSIFARGVTQRIDRAFGRTTPAKVFERAAKREHAHEPRSCEDLIESSQDQGERNLLAAAVDILDVLLESAIEDRLCHDQKSFEFLFGSDRPLGSFSAKIHIARLLDVISDEERNELDIIRNVRNKFAHDFRLVAAGEDRSIVDKVMNLKLGAIDPSRISELEKYEEEFPQAMLNDKVRAKIEASLDELFLRLRARTGVDH